MCVRSLQPRAATALDSCLRAVALAGLICFWPADGWSQDTSSEPPPPATTSDAPLPPDDNGGAKESDDDPLAPGEAFLTRFSGTVTGSDGPVINREGVVGSVIDLGALGPPGDGRRIFDASQRLPVVADEVGQVFGVAIDDAERPTVYLTATSLFGLHRDASNKNWMAGQWGEGGGPGTVYRLTADAGLLPEAFVDITLDGRANTGAALGNIAYDRLNRQLFVSDLETGMIHRISAADGRDLGHFDHGMDGRARFLDAATGGRGALPQVAFDPETGADIEGCGADFGGDPECWNYADFRRRVFGLAVRRDTEGNVRLYYSVWGSDGFGNREWDEAGDDRRNSVWSIRLLKDGDFDADGVRREYVLPAFFGAGRPNAGLSRPVADIAFEPCGRQTTMLLAERGSVRNLGLNAEDAFAYPHEARVLRYGLAGARWGLQGSYEVGFYDRAREGVPRLRANAAGGVAFGYGYDAEGNMDLAKPAATVWATGDTLCGPGSACFDPATGGFDDETYADGLNGLPAGAYDKPGGATNKAQPGPALSKSYVIEADTDTESDSAGRNDATRIGDVAIVSASCEQPVIEPARAAAPPLDAAPPPDLGPEIPAVHDRLMTHARTASPMHDVDRSWHEREWSYHDVDRSWHWREGSWHSRQRSWHWRNQSWHDRAQSWHQRESSWHDRQRSWHWRNQSFHDRQKSWHGRDRSWHERQFSFHDRDRSWHRKGSSGHDRDRSWHWKDQSHHDRSKSWHRRESSSHERDKSWHARDRSWHRKEQSWGEGHLRNRTWHNKGKSFDPREEHRRDKSRVDGHDKERSQALDKRRDEMKDRRDRQRREAEERRKDRREKPDQIDGGKPDDRSQRDRRKEQIEERRKRNEELKKQQEQRREERRKQEDQRKEERGKQKDRSKQDGQTREERRKDQEKKGEERRDRRKDAQEEKRKREDQRKEERRQRQQQQQLLDQSEGEQQQQRRRDKPQKPIERREKRQQFEQQNQQQRLDRQQNKSERQQQKLERRQPKSDGEDGSKRRRKKPEEQPE